MHGRMSHINFQGQRSTHMSWRLEWYSSSFVHIITLLSFQYCSVSVQYLYHTWRCMYGTQIWYMETSWECTGQVEFLGSVEYFFVRVKPLGAFLTICDFLIKQGERIRVLLVLYCGLHGCLMISGFRSGRGMAVRGHHGGDGVRGTGGPRPLRPRGPPQLL